VNTKGFLDQLLQAGRDLAGQGQGMAERGLGIPSSGPDRDAMLSGMGKGALAAGVLGLLLGSSKGRDLAGGALKVGGLAALGGIAYKAYRNWQASQADSGPADPGTPVNELSDSQAEDRSLAILRAMFAAAKADGHVDAAERANIQAGLRELGLDPEAVRALEAEMDGPVDPAAVARGADSPEAAAEIYLASRLVVEVDTWQEKAYLGELAEQLGLAPGLVEQLEAQAAAARR
jgi:uncharacterized membrane protein YebE (DUF533 family)